MSFIWFLNPVMSSIFCFNNFFFSACAASTCLRAAEHMTHTDARDMEFSHHLTFTTTTPTKITTISITATCSASTCFQKQKSHIGTRHTCTHTGKCT